MISRSKKQYVLCGLRVVGAFLVLARVASGSSAAPGAESPENPVVKEASQLAIQNGECESNPGMSGSAQSLNPVNSAALISSPVKTLTSFVPKTAGFFGLDDSKWYDEVSDDLDDLSTSEQEASTGWSASNVYNKVLDIPQELRDKIASEKLRDRELRSMIPEELRDRIPDWEKVTNVTTGMFSPARKSISMFASSINLTLTASVAYIRRNGVSGIASSLFNFRILLDNAVVRSVSILASEYFGSFFLLLAPLSRILRVLVYVSIFLSYIWDFFSMLRSRKAVLHNFLKLFVIPNILMGANSYFFQMHVAATSSFLVISTLRIAAREILMLASVWLGCTMTALRLDISFLSEIWGIIFAVIFLGASRIFLGLWCSEEIVSNICTTCKVSMAYGLLVGVYSEILTYLFKTESPDVAKDNPETVRSSLILIAFNSVLIAALGASIFYSVDVDTYVFGYLLYGLNYVLGLVFEHLTIQYLAGALLEAVKEWAAGIHQRAAINEEVYGKIPGFFNASSF